MKAKSDCGATWVPGAGPLSIRVESSVESLFGRAIVAAARATALEFGVGSGELSIADDGALDCVVSARVEATLRAAGFSRSGATFASSSLAASPALARSPRARRRRSRLYLPGNLPDFLPNAGLFGADCLILDLEDSVPPARKEEARILCRRILEVHRGFFRDSEIIVRINPLSGPWGKADLAELAPSLPHAIILPKCEGAADIEELDRGLDRLENARGYRPGSTLLIPLLETARGVLAASAIAGTSSRIVALGFGAEDFARDIGARKTPAGSESLYARQAVVLAAKAAGVQALDSVFSDTEDAEGFEAWCLASRSMGFDGIGLVHPVQIEIANRAFSPKPEELEEAGKIISAFEEAEARGRGVASLDGKMIDAPVAARARRIAESAPAAPKEGS